VPLASPCDENDAFLEDKFASLIETVYAAGVDGLYVCGATGDGYNLRLDERKHAARMAVELSQPHEGTVIVHVGAANTRDAAELAADAAQASTGLFWKETLLGRCNFRIACWNSLI